MNMKTKLNIMKIIPVCRWCLAGALFLALQSPAWAHAFLEHSKPEVGSTITESPTEVKIWYTQDLVPAFSTIVVRDAQGQEVDKKDVHVSKKDKALLEVSLPKLPPGTYTVSWHVTSVDTHRTEGKWQFTIK
jgi:copper resistance protein C